MVLTSDLTTLYLGLCNYYNVLRKISKANKYSIMRIFELGYFNGQVKRQAPPDEKLSEPETNAVFTFFRTKSYNLMKATLNGLGWTYLDQGAFSFVFMHPDKPYVLKLNYLEDPGFANYVKLIRANPNKYFPKISDAKTLTVVDENYEVYLIEKLYHFESETGKEYSRVIRSIVTHPHTSVNRLFPYGVPSFILENPELINALKLIRKFSRQIGYKMDLHFNNIMQRENGDIVISDPYAFRITSEDEIGDTTKSV